MKIQEYIGTNQNANTKTTLTTSDTNGSSVIIGIYKNGVYVLKLSPIRWVSIKTGIGYDLGGSYNSIRDACNDMLNGGRVFTQQSMDISDCSAFQEAILNYFETASKLKLLSADVKVQEPK